MLISVPRQRPSLKPIIAIVTKREKNTDCMRVARMPSFYLEQQSSSD